MTAFRNGSSQSSKPPSCPIVGCPKRRVGGNDLKGTTVGTYRLYGLDGVGKVASAEWIEAEDDEAGIEAAKKLMDGHRYELWERSRLVTRLQNRPGT